MSDANQDPVVRRAIDEMRRMPDVDRAAVRRVIDAAAVARLTPADDEANAPSARRPRWGLRIGMLAAAAIIGFFARDAWKTETLAKNAVAYDSRAGSELVGAASGERDLQAIPQSFLFNSRAAHKVAVVGDFNRWNAESTRMTRATDGDLWSVTLNILPGRHMYGFMVDDSLFVLDPREPKGRDADLGVEASVIIVGRP